MVRIYDINNLDDDEPLPQVSQSQVRQRNPPKVVQQKEEEEDENTEEGEGDEEEEEEEEGEEAPVRELTFNEQVDQAREQYQPTPMEKFMAVVKSLLLRAMIVYFVMTFIRGSGSPSKPAATTATGPGGDGKPPASLASSNAYPNGTEFDMYVFISEESKKEIMDLTNERLIWKQEGLIYGDWYGGPNNDGTFTHSIQLPLSKKVQNNGSLYIHTFMVPAGFSPDPSNRERYSKSLTVHSSRMVNKFKKKRYAKTHNLLTGETAASIEDQEKAKRMSSEIISHWHPNLTIAIVTDWTQWTLGAVPAPLNEYVKFIPNELKYQPVLFYNDYWNLLKDYTPINSTVNEVALTLTLQPLSLFKWQIYAAQSMRNQWSAANMLSGQEEDGDEDQDTLKEAMIETNPYLLGLTFIISILHSIFEFLAFKNDIQFWNNRKSLEGLSVRSVFFNVFQSLIVLLYVLDNETNFVIRVSVFVGLLIEIWKINKVMDVKVDHTNKVLGLFPRISFADKGSYVESSTREYDRMAFRYLSWLCFPLLAGYAIYSLLYQEHKGYYSWVLSMLYGFLLTFGFIMMTPQLFINYKLKSVAHLPWRMLTYKFLNTFIDDIFAFVIKMPTMYRIGCLRDDVIFFIYLYQRYIYRIDPSRVNEFGFSAEMLDDKGATTTPGADAVTNNGNGTLSIEEGKKKNGGVTKKVSSKNGKKTEQSPGGGGGGDTPSSPGSTTSSTTTKKKSKAKSKKDQ